MPRKMALVIPVLFVSITINAQFKKGERMVGASIGSAFFNSGSSDHTVTSIGTVTGKVTGYGVNILPSMGWFVSENTIIGISFNINPSGDKASYQENGSTFQQDKSSYFNIGIGGFVRNYFRSSGSWLPFGQVNLAGGISNVKQNGFFYGGSGPSAYKKTYDRKSSGGYFADAIFSLGLTKLLGQYTGLDLSFGYNYSYTKNTMKSTELRDNLIDGTIDETGKKETASKFTNHKFILQLGFQVFLERKKK